MSTNRLTLVSAGGISSDASWEAARKEEQRLCAIVEANDSTEDEKYQALLALADLTGVLVHPFADVA